jgi:hypothetical protein
LADVSECDHVVFRNVTDNFILEMSGDGGQVDLFRLEGSAAPEPFQVLFDQVLDRKGINLLSVIIGVC